mmetsp:Transcript_3755/g.15226  ORF Transcript_3755/g.15226 Transcript_3755/m.15226 type:complete len:374 (-) Transcript_3755:1272-2393(-)
MATYVAHSTMESSASPDCPAPRAFLRLASPAPPPPAPAASSCDARATCISSASAAILRPLPNAPTARIATKRCHASATLVRSPSQYVSGWKVFSTLTSSGTTPLDASARMLKQTSLSLEASGSTSDDPGAAGNSAAPFSIASRYPSSDRASVAVGERPNQRCSPKFSRQVSRFSRPLFPPPSPATSRGGGAVSPASRPNVADAFADTYAPEGEDRQIASCAAASSPPLPPALDCASSVASLGSLARTADAVALTPRPAAKCVRVADSPDVAFDGPRVPEVYPTLDPSEPSSASSDPSSAMSLRSHAPTPALRLCRSAADPRGAPSGASPNSTARRSHAAASARSSAAGVARGSDLFNRNRSIAERCAAHRLGS